MFWIRYLQHIRWKSCSRAAANHKFLAAIDAHLAPGAAPLARFIATVVPFGDEAFESLSADQVNQIGKACLQHRRVTYRISTARFSSSVLLRQGIKNRFDVIAIVFLSQFVIVVVLAFQGAVEILLDYNTAVESIPHSCRHLLKRYFCGFVFTAQIEGAHQKNQ